MGNEPYSGGAFIILLADMGKVKVTNAIILVEADEKATFANLNISGHCSSLLSMVTYFQCPGLFSWIGRGPELRPQ
jgi:hypothetical protein